MPGKQYSPASLFSSLCSESPLLFTDTFTFLLTKAGKLEKSDLSQKDKKIVAALNPATFSLSFNECSEVFAKLDLIPFSEFISIVHKNFSLLHPALNRISETCIRNLDFSVEDVNNFLNDNVLYVECIGGISCSHMLLNIIQQRVSCLIDNFGFVQTNTIPIVKEYYPSVDSSNFTFVVNLLLPNGKRCLLGLFTYEGVVRYVISNYDLLFPKKMTMYELFKWLNKQASTVNEHISNSTSGLNSKLSNATLQTGR